MLNLSEALLARLTDPTRAAAIYGDLVELAASRGRAWFWLAYLRTLATLLWRTPTAFLCGCLSLSLGAFVVGHRSRYIPHQAGTLTIVPHFIASLIPFAGIFLIGMATPLWFLVPFGLVRYGARDRLVRLSSLLALLGTAAFFDFAALSLASALVAVLVMTYALCASRWRKPMAIITASAVTGLTALVVFYDVMAKLYHPPIVNLYEPHTAAWIIAKVPAVVAMAVPAIVCSWMHDRILRSDYTEGQHA